MPENYQTLKLNMEEIAAKFGSSLSEYLPNEKENKDCLPFLSIEDEYYILQAICVNPDYYFVEDYQNIEEFETKIIFKTKDKSEVLYFIFRSTAWMFINNSKWKKSSSTILKRKVEFTLFQLNPKWAERFKNESD
ncbi:hypothetical protein [Flavobacterium sp.]|uniref:hypothetical protein n=1 Tax=Flavobacterium sp. TaxID=239 RepID=UPI003750BF8A